MLYNEILEVLNNYPDLDSKVDSSNKTYQTLVVNIPKSIRSFLNRSNFRVVGAMGQGNKALIPWISILNTRITSSTQRGLYVVLLFKSDMSGFYLSLNQGITFFEKKYRNKKYDFAEKVAQYFRDQIEDHAFTSSPIDLVVSKGSLGYGYMKTNIVSRYYPANQFSEIVLEHDILDMISIYDEIVSHMGSKSYDDVILDILQYEVEKAPSIEEALDIINEIVNPDKDLPHDLIRTLIEQEPTVRKSKKYSRITQAVPRKIDYVKRAKRQAEIGIIGEDLVMRYELARLTNLGLTDYIEKTQWANDDSKGYDIESFDIDEKGNIVPIKIEVKSTECSADVEFFISKNEVDKSNELKDEYHIYRVYDLNSINPKFYKTKGPVEDSFFLDPVTFMARYKFPKLLM